MDAETLLVSFFLSIPFFLSGIAIDHLIFVIFFLLLLFR